MKHRLRAEINQRLQAITETWFQTFIGFVAMVIVILLLVFFVEFDVESGD